VMGFLKRFSSWMRGVKQELNKYIDRKINKVPHKGISHPDGVERMRCGKDLQKQGGLGGWRRRNSEEWSKFSLNLSLKRGSLGSQKSHPDLCSKGYWGVVDPSPELKLKGNTQIYQGRELY